MRANIVMYDLMDIQGSLQSIFCLGVGIRSSPESAILSSYCSILCLKMVGMNLSFRQALIRVRVFPLSCLIFWAFAAFFMFLVPLVLYTYFDSFRKSSWRTPRFSRFQWYPYETPIPDRLLEGQAPRYEASVRMQPY